MIPTELSASTTADTAPEAESNDTVMLSTPVSQSLLGAMPSGPTGQSGRTVYETLRRAPELAARSLHQLKRFVGQGQTLTPRAKERYADLLKTVGALKRTHGLTSTMHSQAKTDMINTCTRVMASYIRALSECTSVAETNAGQRHINTLLGLCQPDTDLAAWKAVAGASAQFASTARNDASRKYEDECAYLRSRISGLESKNKELQRSLGIPWNSIASFVKKSIGSFWNRKQSEESTDPSTIMISTRSADSEEGGKEKRKSREKGWGGRDTFRPSSFAKRRTGDFTTKRQTTTVPKPSAKSAYRSNSARSTAQRLGSSIVGGTAHGIKPVTF